MNRHYGAGHAFGSLCPWPQSTVSPGAHKARRPASSLAGFRGIASAHLVVIAVDLLKEGLGVECVGWAGHAGDDRKRNQGGQDSLHGISP